MTFQCRPYLLVGMMGVGKTSVGELLALATNLPFHDMDRDFVNRYGKIKLFFQKHGVAEFRRIESEEIRKLLDNPNQVISTGGGTFVQPNNIDLMLRKGIVIWLDAPFEVIAERIRLDPVQDRPLANDDMLKLLIERKPLYAKARIRVDATQSIEDIVKDILKQTRALAA